MRDGTRNDLKRTWLRRILEAGSTGAVVATAVVSLQAPPAEASTQAPVQTRVQTAKETLQQLLATPEPGPGATEKLITWWGNWRNGGGGWGVGHPWWHNWPNWHNWHNWPNWHNW